MKHSMLTNRMLFLGLLSVIGMSVIGCGATPTTPTSPASVMVASPTPRATSTAASPVRPDASTPMQRFSFIFEYGNCLTNQIDNRLDTAQGTFTLDGPLRSSAMTIPLILTDNELNTIYQKMVDIGFFNYSAQFAIPVGQGTTAAGIYPSATYHWIVNGGTQMKEVAWSDSIVAPTTVEAERLRELAKLIQQIIDAHPEIQQLAPYFLHCA